MNSSTSPFNAIRLLVGIDCIVFGFDGNEIRILLSKNGPPVTGSKWCLPGSFLYEGEDLDTGVERIVFNFTGIRKTYLEQLKAFSNTNSSSTEQQLTIAFFGLVKIEQPAWNLAVRQNSSWQKIENHVQLPADQQGNIEKALSHLRYKAALHPIGFELLPELFSLPQMQRLYEAIYDTEFDRRNFSEKILSTGLLIDTGLRSKTSATNKAKLYKLDAEKYRQKFYLVWNFLPDVMKTLHAPKVHV